MTSDSDKGIEKAREEPVMVPQDALSRVIIAGGIIFALAFIAVTIFTFYEVVMRYVFDAPTSWVHETTIAITALCFAYGGAYCLGSDRHIRIVLLYDALGPRFRRWLDIVISIAGTAACALMGWAAYGLAYGGLFRAGGGFRLETSGSAWNPPTPAIVKAFLFATLCVMTIQFALQTIRHIRRKPDDEAPTGEVEHGMIDDV